MCLVSRVWCFVFRVMGFSILFSIDLILCLMLCVWYLVCLVCVFGIMCIVLSLRLDVEASTVLGDQTIMTIFWLHY